MSEPQQEWTKAFVAACSEMPPITKNKTVTTNRFSYSYADLPDIVDAVRPVLAKNGLGIGQTVESNGPGTVAVTTRIYHSAGHSETFGPLTLPAGNDAQSAGSAITYARRYSLCAALGIAADEDDDGALAKRSSGAARPSQPTPKTSREAAPESVGESAGKAKASTTEPKSSGSPHDTGEEGSDSPATRQDSTPASPEPSSLVLIEEALKDGTIKQNPLTMMANKVAMKHNAIPEGGITSKTIERLPTHVLDEIASELGLRQEQLV